MSSADIYIYIYIYSYGLSSHRNQLLLHSTNPVTVSFASTAICKHSWNLYDRFVCIGVDLRQPRTGQISKHVRNLIKLINSESHYKIVRFLSEKIVITELLEPKSKIWDCAQKNASVANSLRQNQGHNSTPCIIKRSVIIVSGYYRLCLRLHAALLYVGFSLLDNHKKKQVKKRTHKKPSMDGTCFRYSHPSLLLITLFKYLE
jgi:hypothetical protein